MRANRHIPTLVLFLLLLFAAACAPQAAEVVEIPTLAVLPGVTPSPTPVPPPTETPTVTPTPSATPRPPCDWVTYWDTVEPSVVEFLDTGDVAANTPRASLSPIVLELQRAWRDFQRLEVPECASAVHDQLAYGMEMAKEGFNYFLGNIDYASEIAMTIANQFLFNAAMTLENEGVIVDTRLASARDILGGNYPSYDLATRPVLLPEALDDFSTQLSQDIDDMFATSTARAND